MIVVRNLTKLYSSGKDEVLALDSLNFSLPDKGLVFIIGKSGSGKSTLINIIGGLDDITSGEVIVDGLSIGKLTQRKLDEYHNNYLGIIYQNYNLFEEESVLENVQISNRICKNRKSQEEIEELLHKLELKSRINTTVSNLSGGQKQRVAIARALVKGPKLILADEPTGNLDSKTTKTIFNLLKRISKDCLVIVITHDMKSALNYADRIIGLSDGKIVSDLTKNLKGAASTLYVELDEQQEINDEKIQELNEAIKKTKYKLIRKGEHFVPTESVETETEPQNKAEEKPKVTFRKSLLLGLKSSKRNIFTLITTSLINMLVIGLLSLSSSFIKFDGENAINAVSKNYEINNLIIRKSFSSTGRIVDMNKKFFIEVNDKDEERFDSLDLSGKRYPLYSVNLMYSEHGLYSDASQNNNEINYENFYPMNGYGVIGCDIDYLTKVFRGELEVLAGSLYDIGISYKVIVSDFVADSVLFYNPAYKSNDPNDPYQKIINNTIKSHFRIGAVVKTDYKEKYAAFLDVLGRMQREPQNSSEIKKAILQSDLFINFVNDCQSYLNYGYTLNPDFLTSYRNFMGYAFSGFSLCSIGDDPTRYEISDNLAVHYNKNVTGHNVIMQIDKYNELFGMNCVDPEDPTFEEKDITLYNFSRSDKYKENVLHTIDLHISGLQNKQAYAHFGASREVLFELLDWNTFQFGWAYTEPGDCYQIYRKLSPYFFYNSIDCFSAVYNTIDIITIFSEVFSILLYVLLGVLALVIVMHNVRVIKKEQYRLGVLKSLGYSNLYLTIVVLVSNVVMLLGIFGLSIGFSYGTSFLVNKLLQFGFAKYSSNRIYYKITMLVFRFDYTALFNLITLGIMFISSFVPLLIIRKIKPSKIIRNAE